MPNGGAGQGMIIWMYSKWLVWQGSLCLQLVGDGF